MLMGLSLNSDLWLWIFRMWLRVIFAWLLQCRVYAAEPSFRVPPINVTVIEGDVAVLPCTINHLTEEHKVVWTDATGFVLTLDDTRLLEDTRLSVERPFKRLWNLHIRDVQHADRGKYICQIMTKPPKQSEVLLEVFVPPHIDDEFSSTDITVKEGETFTLVCNATGYPQPEIRWFRYTSEHLREREKIGKSGEMLKIHNVSRDCGGTYICEADNNVDKVVTKEITVTVHYKPEIFLPTIRLGLHLGKETFLQCRVTANPHGVMYWERNGTDLLSDGTGKYLEEVYDSDADDDKKTISLRIRALKPEDFGQYTCHAQNFLGKDKETMILYDYSVHDKQFMTPSRGPFVEQRPVTFNPVVGMTFQPPSFKDEIGNENTGSIRGSYRSVAIKTGSGSSLCHVITAWLFCTIFIQTLL
ncbi:Fibroblast growth factor receptor 3 [Mactra antiquata]